MAEYRFPTQTEVPTILETASPLTNLLLYRRGITDAEEASRFLAPNYEEHLHSALLLNDIEAACTRIEQAITAGQRIAIFSDYDCDGIPGAVVLNDFFSAIGHENLTTYIPHRHYEGFGLSTDAIDKLKADDVDVIITIDCGTSNVSEVAHANELGIDVIITDHHEPEEVLPAAVAVVNPKLGAYPFPDLCGAAVAFKLAQALLDRNDFAISPGQEKWWLDMVGLATIADMVPLVGENRVLAHYGLMVLRKSRRPGLQQLLKKARADQRYLTEDDVGFTIGPRVNAASRMDSPEDALVLLVEKDVEKASERVEHLEGLNQQRKTMVAQMTKDLHKRLQELDGMPSVLVMGNPEWRPSLVGLAASKLAEEHHRPVFLWGKDGNGVFKGSCRSGGTASVVTLMQAVPELFLEYGGHHASGGFSVKDEHIFTFGERLAAAMDELGERAIVKEPVDIDIELTLEEVTPLLIKDLARLAPYGAGHRKPLIAFPAVVPSEVQLFGKGKEHTKLLFPTESGRLEAIAFFQTPTDFTRVPEAEQSCTLIGHVEQSFFMGRMQTRIRIVDIL
jgi:single-stranded-DNA-specific exonuclease